MATRPSPAWIEVTINCVDVEVVAGFWCRLLGLDRAEESAAGLGPHRPDRPRRARADLALGGGQAGKVHAYAGAVPSRRS
ncbi:MAG: hypothetical protein ACRDZR_07060 [Acidimicrobiales bacterium]